MLSCCDTELDADTSANLEAACLGHRDGRDEPPQKHLLTQRKSLSPAVPRAPSSARRSAENNPPRVRSRTQQCLNCHQFHKGPRSETHSEICFFVSAEDPYLPAPTMAPPSEVESLTLPMPPSLEMIHKLFQSIWTCFDEIKAENEAWRSRVAESSLEQPASTEQVRSLERPYRRERNKINLRTEAPLVWLKWRAADGVTEGKTRKQSNWEDTWRRLVLNESVAPKGTKEMPMSKQNVNWITIHLPSTQLQTLIQATWDDEQQLEEPSVPVRDQKYVMP